MEKEAFKELKNIQIVLLSAMVRVDRNYTLFQFENDIKSVLTKCVKTFKKTNIADVVDENPIANEAPIADEAAIANESSTADKLTTEV